MKGKFTIWKPNASPLSYNLVVILLYRTERLFLPNIRKMLTMKQPHMALFVAPTGVAKTHLALDLLEREYFNHFDFIVIICPTLEHNKTYRSRKWVWTDPEVIYIEPSNHLYD